MRWLLLRAWELFVTWVICPEDEPTVSHRLRDYLRSRAYGGYHPQICEVSQLDYWELLLELQAEHRLTLVQDGAVFFDGTWVTPNPNLAPNHWRILL